MLPTKVALFPHEIDYIIAQKHGGKTDAENLAYITVSEDYPVVVTVSPGVLHDAINLSVILYSGSDV
ncbi:hypothetical protein [Nostoc sp. LEGE 06077]|uniref:hypothetical protein n=1 Tax=Nostoc sp. LEGE 06077 TaxID=915325 RepID=UPI002AD28265|nr:hypothetical protein [Nostoc sp. LEGE 06077]